MILRTRLRWLLVLFTVGALLASLIPNADYYVTPYISAERYQKLVFAGRYLKERGWTEPIYVSFGDPGIWFWSIDRSYRGIEAGLDLSRYGYGQELCLLPPPPTESSYHGLTV